MAYCLSFQHEIIISKALTINQVCRLHIFLLWWRPCRVPLQKWPHTQSGFCPLPSFGSFSRHSCCCRRWELQPLVACLWKSLGLLCHPSLIWGQVKNLFKGWSAHHKRALPGRDSFHLHQVDRQDWRLRGPHDLLWLGMKWINRKVPYTEA